MSRTVTIALHERLAAVTSVLEASLGVNVFKNLCQFFVLESALQTETKTHYTELKENTLHKSDILAQAVHLQNRDLDRIVQHSFMEACCECSSKLTIIHSARSHNRLQNTATQTHKIIHNNRRCKHHNSCSIRASLA